MKSGHGAPQRAAVLAAVVIVSGLALGGCGSSALPGLPNLTTGSLSPTPAAAPEVKPITPVDRALHIATTSARAQKCGYNFDPARLRESFLAAEPLRGTSPRISRWIRSSSSKPRRAVV